MLNAQNYEKKSYRFSVSVVSKLMNTEFQGLRERKTPFFHLPDETSLTSRDTCKKLKS